MFESLHGYGVYTARATQLAKMVIKIKYSNGLNNESAKEMFIIKRISDIFLFIQ